MAAQPPQQPRRAGSKPSPEFPYEQPGAGRTDEWYTPPEVFAALGTDFDLDPAAPPGGVPWVPAVRSYCLADDGLTRPWRGRIWLNPPYGRQTGPWLTRLAEHGDGLALVYARTDTRWFHQALSRATAICFLAGRLHFIAADHRRRSNATAPSVLIAYGLPSALALAQSGLGQTLIVPRPGSS
jgi:hypothetical protein